MNIHRNLFVTVLTYAAPSANYRGEGEANKNVLQRLKIGNKGEERAIISSESIRNAIRETLIKYQSLEGNPYNLNNNRNRLHDAGQPAVRFQALPNPNIYSDDYLFGYLVARSVNTDQMGDIPAKRDSVLRQNLALALNFYSNDSTMHQSPAFGSNFGDPGSPWQNTNDGKSAIIYKERTYTAFQFPFALAYSDCIDQPTWVKALLKAISELSDVAGNSSGSLFNFEPRSIVARLTSRLAPGYDFYGFNESGNFPELSRVNEEDLPKDEFWIGGEIVRNMDDSERGRFNDNQLQENPQQLIENLSEAFLPESNGS